MEPQLKSQLTDTAMSCRSVRPYWNAATYSFLDGDESLVITGRRQLTVFWQT